MYSRRGFIIGVLAAIASITAGYMAFLKYFKEPYTPTPVPTPVPTSTPTPTPIETLESKIHENLLFHVPDIEGHDKRVIDAAVLQIRDDIYNPTYSNPNGLATDEKLAWDYISKAVNFVLPGLENVDLKNYSDMDLRQILLPTNLRTIDIKSILDGDREIKYNHGGLGYGLKNVTPDESLGEKSPQEFFSPQEVLGKRVRTFYNDKDSIDYKEAKYFSKGAAPSWTNSTAAFLEVRDEMLKRDEMLNNGEDAPFFVIGWPIYIVGEQNSSQFSSLVGRSMEKPLAAYYSSADYPSGRTSHGNPLTHSEPLVSYNGRFIGAWMFEKEFSRDYEGKLNEPRISFLGPDGKSYHPHTLKLIPM